MNYKITIKRNSNSGVNFKLYEKFFYLAYMLYFGALFAENAMQVTDYSSIVFMVKFLSLAILLVSFVMITKKKGFKLVSKERKIVFCILVLVTLYGILFKDMIIIMFCLFIYVAQFVNTEKIMKISIIILIALIAFVLLMYKLGYFAEVVVLSETNFSARKSFGFYHYSKLPLAIMFLSFFYFTTKKKILTVEIFLFACLNYYLYRMCGSRNSFISMSIFLLMIIILKLGIVDQYSSIVWIIIKVSVPIFVVISFLMLYIYILDPQIGIVLDLFFNSRFVTAYNFIQQNGLHLFSYMSYEDYLNMQGRTKVDNSYFYLTFRYGLFSLFELLGLFLLLIRKAQTKKAFSYAFVLLSFSIAIFIDNIVLNYGSLALVVYGFGIWSNGTSTLELNGGSYDSICL